MSKGPSVQVVVVAVAIWSCGTRAVVPGSGNDGGFVSIPSGTFIMGSSTSAPCRGSKEDLHPVTLTHGFEILDHEVTQGEFQGVMSYNPANFTSCGSRCPVEKVNWHEAVAYCNALSSKSGKEPCYTCSGSGASVTCQDAPAYSGHNIYTCPGYRLPTEAEWEYAYRAGTTTAFYNGANNPTKCIGCTDANAAAIGWHGCNAGSTTHPVKHKLPNAWRIHDMAGNVWEWCHDWYQDRLGTSAVTDPVSSGAGSSRMLRGGSWSYVAKDLRAANRIVYSPSSRYKDIGFRCVRTSI